MLKWTEPDDARKPVDRWRIYEYKNGEQVKVLHIHRQSAFLIGRIKDIADILTMHPSCSGQHAVLQFRLKVLKDDLDEVRVVLPYVMDLESTNGTFLNGERLAPARYVELREKDMLKFGSSSRNVRVLIRAPASSKGARMASFSNNDENAINDRVSGPRRRPRRGPRPSRPREHISPGGASQKRGGGSARAT